MTNDPILITGATGGLGRFAVETLSAQGVPVIATGRNTAILAKLSKLPHVQTIATDITSLIATTLLTQIKTPISAIWHCAALSSPTGPLSLFENSNLIATQQILDVAKALNVPKLVHVSTPAIYFDYQHKYNVHEDNIAFPEVNLPILEKQYPVGEDYTTVSAKELPLKFSSHYAYTKFLAEIAVRLYAEKYQRKVAILRPRALIGPYDNVLLPKIMEAQSKYGCVPLPRNGKAITSPTPVPNVVNAMWLLTQYLQENEYSSPQVFNVAGQEHLSLDQILNILEESSGLRFIVKNIPYHVLKHVVKAYERIVPENKQSISSYSLGVVNYDMTLNIDKLNAIGFNNPVSTEKYLRQLANQFVGYSY